MDYSIHVGPYIRIEEMPKTKVEREIEGCQKCETNTRRRNFHYCPSCGEKIVVYKKESEEPLSTWRLLDEQLGNTLSHGGDHILIPYGVGELRLDSDFLEGEYDLPSNSITPLVEKYTKELMRLTELGVKYKIVSGIVIYPE
jgi:hypothetical protein